MLKRVLKLEFLLQAKQMKVVSSEGEIIGFKA